ncbi:MAG: FKBP-type peptidyl-prolyl cis-trans isomerase [Alistipes sp.]|nr:FKBP-type peptidyl-prolyl cis-trans isomerase [Alistipes sp.]
MKRLLYISVMVLAMLAAGCADDEDYFTSQQDTLVRYLESSRRLVAEAEVPNVIEENPKFYTTFGRSTYRYIPNYYEEGREDWATVEVGSTVEIIFDAYVFSGSEPSTSATALYWSNIPTTISRIENSSSNKQVSLTWSTEPLSFKVGNGDVIEGLDQALVGCHDQDSVQLYMSYNMAYGKQLVGTVPKKSAVAWYIKILNVIK